MFQNYCRIAWRNLLKERQFTLLNLLGLSTGLAAALLIFLWVNDELHFDRFHRYDDRLFQVMVNDRQGDRIVTGASTGGLLGEALEKEMPEVQYAVTTTPEAWFQQFSLSFNGRVTGARGNFVGSNYFKVFSYKLLQGSKDKVLSGRQSIVISRQLALKLFGTTDNVVGKMLEWKWTSVAKPCMVTGVFEEAPFNSSSRLDFVLPLDCWKEIVPATADVGGGPFNTFLVLKEGADVARFNSKIGPYIKSKFKQSTYTLFVRRFSDAYLYGNFENGVQSGGRITYVKLLSVIAIFILLIACINFMNLATARATGRIKEVGVKKALGAARHTLVFQFLGEALMMSFLSLLLALGLVFALLPRFNEITGKHIAATLNPALLLPVLGITVITGLLAGSYPALYLSRFKPALTLKEKLDATAGGLWLRKGLVVFQFAVSVVFIIAVIVVHKQVRFIETKPLGYNRNNVLYFEMEGRVAQQPDAFLAGLKSIPGVVNASTIQQKIVMPTFVPGPGVQWEGKNGDDRIRFYQMPANYDLVETLGIEMKEGRAFSRSFGTDTGSVILNEAAVKMMQLEDPVGKMITFRGAPKRVAGVARNFHFNSLHEAISPFIFYLSPQETMLVMARIGEGQEKATIARLQEYYKTFNPGFSLNYKFLDSDYQAQYVSEKLVAALSRYFAGLAILISCLGLLGLAAFTAQRRQKEIGIRKVLGATAGNIALMLSGDFLKLVLLSVLIAFPLAWWATHSWLQGFAYRAQIGAPVFIAAGAAIIVITLLTVSFQSVMAALRNPVKSLRTE